MQLCPASKTAPLLAFLAGSDPIGDGLGHLDQIISMIEEIHLRQEQRFEILPSGWREGRIETIITSATPLEVMIADDGMGFFSIRISDTLLSPSTEAPEDDLRAKQMLDRGLKICDLSLALSALRLARDHLSTPDRHREGWTPDLVETACSAQRLMSLAYELSGLAGEAEGYFAFSHSSDGATLTIIRESGPQFTLVGPAADRFRADIPSAIQASIQTKEPSKASPRGHQEIIFLPLDTYMPLSSPNAIEQMRMIKELEIGPGDLVLKEILP